MVGAAARGVQIPTTAPSTASCPAAAVVRPPRQAAGSTRSHSRCAVLFSLPLLAFLLWRAAVPAKWAPPRVSVASSAATSVPSSVPSSAATPMVAPKDPPVVSIKPQVVPDDPQPVAPPPNSGWQAWLKYLSRVDTRKYVIVDAKNGLGNRLRALSSAMSVAASLHRQVLLLWASDLHCNCSFTGLFREPLPFALLHVEIPRANLSTSHFQIYNYMRPEPGAIKDEEIFVDPRRHIYFKSAFIMNHYRGQWKFTQRHLQPPLFPQPVAAVEAKLITDRSMVGLHVRNVFDAPRDAASAKETVGSTAISEANKEYGEEGASELLKWRGASHWSNFVKKMAEMLEEHRRTYPPPLHPPLRFYLAADSSDAYVGLSKRFGDSVLFTRRDCSAERCDFRDCEALRYSLIDLMNLARTRLILGSGYSSYSEVAARMGGTWQRSLPILMAGKDFGETILDTPPSGKKRRRPRAGVAGRRRWLD